MASRSSSNSRRRHSCRRSPIIGCRPRSTSSSTRPPGSGPEREQVDRRHPAAAPRLGDRDDDPVQRRRRRNLGERGAQPSRSSSRHAAASRCSAYRSSTPSCPAGERLARGGRRRSRSHATSLELDIRRGQLLAGVRRIRSAPAPRRARRVARARIPTATGCGSSGAPSPRRAADERPGCAAPIATVSRGASGRGQSTIAAIRSCASVRSGSLVRCRHVLLHLGIHPFASLRDHRFVEVAKADLASEVARGPGRGRRARRRGGRGPRRKSAPTWPTSSSASSSRRSRIATIARARDLGPLLGEEQPVAGLLQAGRALEAGDPVVSERPRKRGGEPRRQSLRLGVERAQPRVQVLLRALQERGLDLLVAAVGAGQRAQVREHPQQPVLARDQRRVARRAGRRTGRAGRRSSAAPRRRRCRSRAPATASGAGSPGRGRARRRRRRSGQRTTGARPAASGAAGSIGSSATSGACAATWTFSPTSTSLHPAPERRGERRLHLHRLDHRDHIPGLDDVPGGHGNRDQQG